MKKYLKIKLIIAVLLTSGFAAQNSSAIEISRIYPYEVKRDVSNVSKLSNCSVTSSGFERAHHDDFFVVYVELPMIYQNTQGEEKYVTVLFQESIYYESLESGWKNPNFSYDKVEQIALGYCEQFKNSMNFFLPKSNAAETSPELSRKEPLEERYTLAFADVGETFQWPHASFMEDSTCGRSDKRHIFLPYNSTVTRLYPNYKSDDIKKIFGGLSNAVRVRIIAYPTGFTTANGSNLVYAPIGCEGWIRMPKDNVLSSYVHEEPLASFDGKRFDNLVGVRAIASHDGYDVIHDATCGSKLDKTSPMLTTLLSNGSEVEIIDPRIISLAYTGLDALGVKVRVLTNKPSVTEAKIGCEGWINISALTEVAAKVSNASAGSDANTLNISVE